MEGVQDPKAQNRKHGVAGLGAAFFFIRTFACAGARFGQRVAQSPRGRGGQAAGTS
jgi:hypothetical protein